MYTFPMTLKSLTRRLDVSASQAPCSTFSETPNRKPRKVAPWAVEQQRPEKLTSGINRRGFVCHVDNWQTTGNNGEIVIF